MIGIKRSKRLVGGWIGGVAAPAPLIWLSAALSFAVAAGSIVALDVERSLTALKPRFAGDVTIAVRGRGLESADAAAARAVESLVYANSAAKPIVLEPDRRDAAVADLIGAGRLGEVRLVSVVAPSSLSAPRIMMALSTAGIPATVDDHRVADGPVQRIRRRLGFAALAILAVTGVVMPFAGSRAVGDMILRDRDRIDLASRLGAETGTMPIWRLRASPSPRLAERSSAFWRPCWRRCCWRRRRACRRSWRRDLLAGRKPRTFWAACPG